MLVLSLVKNPAQSVITILLTGKQKLKETKYVV